MFLFPKPIKKTVPNNILLFRDTNKDGIAENGTVFLKGLDMPFGMLILNNKFYVANTGSLMEYPYKEGATSITAPGKKIVSFRPAPGIGQEISLQTKQVLRSISLWAHQAMLPKMALIRKQAVR